MSRIITTDYGDKYKTASLGTTTGAIIAGSIASSAIQQGGSASMLPIITKMGKVSKECDNATLRKGIEDAFEKSGLKSKGVEILDLKSSEEFKNPCDILNNLDKAISQENMASANKKLNEALLNALPKPLQKSKIGKLYARIIQGMLENGINAGFISKSNKIAVNIDELGTSTFHEMGHAINKNSTTFWKGMQKLRGPMQMLGGAFSTVALFKRKKVEGEEPTGIFDKTTTFIKNNVGKLVTLSFVPIVAEELMATRRGNKLAEQVLPKDILKKVKTTNKLGALTYITGALLAGTGAFVASKVRDKIAKPKEI